MAFPRYVLNQIANLRGLPEDHSRSWNKDTKEFTGALDQVLKKYQIGEDKAQDTIIKNWQKIASDQFYKKCRPEKITNNNYLVIVASNTIIRQELLFQQRKILLALSSYPECAHINKLVIKV